MQPIQPASPGQPLRASDINAANDELKRQGNVTVDGANATSESTGVHLTVPTSKGFWARINGQLSRYYGYYEVIRSVDGWIPKEDGRTSTPQEDYAVEINNNTSVPMGMVVWLEPISGFYDGNRNKTIYSFTHSSYGYNSNIVSVVTDIGSDANGLVVNRGLFQASNSDTIKFGRFTELLDVVPKTLTGNANRVVVVNAFGTGLEFGADITASGGAGTFLQLPDTPNSYSGSNFYVVTVVGSALEFRQCNISVTGSIKGGGNPLNTSGSGGFVTLSLQGDAVNPGANKYYGTNSTAIKGFYDLPDLATINTTITQFNTRVTNVESSFASLLVRMTAAENNIAALQTSVTNLITITSTHTTQITTLVSDVTNLDTRLDAAEGDITNLKSRVSTLESKMTAAENNINDLQTLTSTHTTQIATLTTRITDAENDISSLTTLTATHTTQISNLQGDVSDLQGDVSSLTTTVAGHTTSINSLLSRMTAAEGSISTLTSQMTTANSNIATLQSNVTTLQTNVGTLQTNVSNLTSTVNSLSSTVSSLQTTVGTLGTDLTALTGRVTTAEGSITTLQSQMTTANANISTLQTNVSTLTSDLSGLTNTVNSIDGRLSTAEGTIVTINSTLGDHETRITTLEADVLAINSSITTIQSDIGSLDTRLTTAEGTIVTIQGDVSTLQSDLTQEITDRQTGDNGLDSRLLTLEGQTLDARLITLENQTLDTRITTLENQTLDSRLITLEGQNLDTRITDLEGYVSASGLTVGGTQVVGSQQSAVADAAGGTIDDTDVASCASSTQTIINDLTTQLNAALNALRAHGLIAS
jgi:predicted  nucleic acid-binding Zn-ribbon protein